MIEHVHTHITSELQQNAKTGIVFILASISLNLITLAVNLGMAEKSRTDNTMMVAICTGIIAIIVPFVMR